MKYFRRILVISLSIVIFFCIFFSKSTKQQQKNCELSIFEPKFPDKISIVMPFHIKQAEKVIKLMDSWSLYRPCDLSSMPFRIDFIFFIARSNNQNFDAEKFTKHKNLECFSRVEIVEYVFLDQRLDNHNMGSRIMFEYMLNRSDDVFKKQSFIFYMEPDTRPIRQNWLIGLYKECIDENFWIKGSIQRGKKMKSFTDSFHINGNAIYNIGDENFRNFYFQSVKLYFDKINFRYGYDGGIFKYLYDLNNIDQVKHIFHKFQFRGFVYNSCLSNYSVEKLADQFKDTIFVHGGIQI